MSTGTEVGFCPRCQAAQTLRSSETVAMKRSASGIRLVRRRELDCTNCSSFLSIVETTLRTEVIAGKP